MNWSVALLGIILLIGHSDADKRSIASWFIALLEEECAHKCTFCTVTCGINTYYGEETKCGSCSLECASCCAKFNGFTSVSAGIKAGKFVYDRIFPE